MNKASVFLLHFPLTAYQAARVRNGRGLGGHYLAVWPEAGDPPIPATMARGPGAVPVPAGAVLADVWECADAREAEALYRRLARQGGRRRICSICSPGNARGSGTGNWQRQKPR